MSAGTDFLASLQKATLEKAMKPKASAIPVANLSKKAVTGNVSCEKPVTASFLPQSELPEQRSSQQMTNAPQPGNTKMAADLALLLSTAQKTKQVQPDVIERVAEKEKPKEIADSTRGVPMAFISNAAMKAPKQKEGTLRVAAYIRVSTDMSDQENSYEEQDKYFRQLIESNPNWRPIGVYSDYGISGTSGEKRTGFKRIIRHCQEGKIDRILCKSISRFARNTADFMIALRILQKCNVTIYFEKENLDTADPTSEFILTTLAAIAQEESRSISGNINVGNKMRYTRGDIRNVEMYGYRFSGNMVTCESGYKYKDVEIIEEEAEIVRRIFREVADCKPYTEIARDLNRDGIPAPESRYHKKRQQKSKKGQLDSDFAPTWTAGRIRSIASNERYVGDVLAQKTYTADFLTHKVKVNKGEVQQYRVRDHHVAIVDRELYDEVQAVLKLNESMDSGKREGKEHAFSGRLICGNCGRFYSIRNSKTHPIWFCPSTKLPGKAICHAEKIYEEQIIRVVRRAVLERYDLTVQPVHDDVNAADIMSGHFEAEYNGFAPAADGFLVAMIARLENFQRLDFMERDRNFYKRQLSAVSAGLESTRKKMRLVRSQVDVLETRRTLLGDENVDEAKVAEKARIIKELQEKLARQEDEYTKLSEQLEYMESYWEEMEEDYDRREKALQWMKTLPQNREGTMAFLNGLTDEHCKAFILSVTIHSPLNYTIHWFDDTRTDVTMDSLVEDYRYTASYYDGHVMRDRSYRDRYKR